MRHPQSLVNPAEVVVGDVQSQCRSEIRQLFADALVNLVNLRHIIRMVKFCGSTWLVQILLGSGFPVIGVHTTSVTRGGAYLPSLAGSDSKGNHRDEALRYNGGI
jgi:hypothetical protein